MKYFTLIAVLFLTGCPAVCAHLDTRCFDGNPQTCNANGRWETAFECDDDHTCVIDHEDDPVCMER
jgi:hypothetical protein